MNLSIGTLCVLVDAQLSQTLTLTWDIAPSFVEAVSAIETNRVYYRSYPRE